VECDGAAGGLSLILAALVILVLRHPHIVSDPGQWAYRWHVPGIHAKHPPFRPGRTLRRTHVRTGERHPRLSTPLQLVRRRPGPRPRPGADGRATGPRAGGPAYLVHHRKHARSTAPHRHAAGGRAVPAAVGPVGIPRPGRVGLPGDADVELRTHR